MEFEAATLDDILHKILTELLNRPFDVKATRGTSSEIFGASIQLTNPRARLSRTETKGKPFSALGELFWYLSKNNDLDFIKYYIHKYIDNSDDGITIHGGYGKRIFNMRGKYDQLDCIIKLLKEHPTTRRAVIQILDAEDMTKKYKDIPCTNSIQFAIRNNKLLMHTSMRSNDAFIGMPHDVFTFTMLQEIVAKTLDLEVGVYSHSVASLHLYNDNKKKAEDYLNEGFQSTTFNMPAMPNGDPWPSLEIVKKIESEIRTGYKFDIATLNLDSYWIDLVILLQIFSCFKKVDLDEAWKLKDKITNKNYQVYIESRFQNIPDAKK